MSQLPIYLYGTDVLKKKAKKVTEVTNADIALIKNMFETMHEANGIGLAANQIGELKQILVMDISDMEAGKGIKPLVVINPEVIEEEGEWEFEEGCLSIPEVRDDVERCEKIRIRFKDARFADVEMEAHGILSRVILHEIDHLNGVLFTDHLSGVRKKLHHKALKKIQRGEIDVNYPVITAVRVSV